MGQLYLNYVAHIHWQALMSCLLSADLDEDTFDVSLNIPET